MEALGSWIRNILLHWPYSLMMHVYTFFNLYLGEVSHSQDDSRRKITTYRQIIQ